MDIREGKQSISQSAFSFLAQYVLKLQPVQHVYSWQMLTFGYTFMVLLWNLCARSVGPASVMHKHISWSQDALIIDAAMSKGNQDGTRTLPKHLYANPLEPWVCPIFALAVYVWSTPISKTGQLFEGEDQENHFSKVWKAILKRIPQNESDRMGIDADKLGTHTLRKSVAQFLSSVCDILSMIEIFKRCEWSLGLQDTYLKDGSPGGDQKCGRVASCLPTSTVDFMLLPPHFSAADEADLEMSELLQDWEQYPAGMKSALPKLLASLCHHADYIKQHLSPQHPFKQTRLYRNKHLERLRLKVHVGHGYNATTQLQATGIPLSFVILQEVGTMKSSLQTLNDGIMELKETLPTAVVDLVKRDLNVEGVVAVTAADVARIVEDAFDRRALLRVNGHQPQQQQQQGAAGDDEPFVFFLWSDESMRRWPESKPFPHLTASSGWDAWFFGDVNARIRPYKQLKASDLKLKTCKKEFARLSFVMRTLVDIAQTKHTADVDAMNNATSDEIFKKSFQDLCVIISVRDRAGTMAIGTLRNKLSLVYGHRRTQRRRVSYDDSDNDDDQGPQNNGDDDE
jgi:hypothetical protein